MKVAKIKANIENGEASLKLTKAFRRQDPLVKADIISDLIFDLDKEYLKARKEMQKVYSDQ